MTGGGALIRGLDVLLPQETGLPIHVDEDPLTCVVRGTGRILDDSEKYHSVLSKLACCAPDRTFARRDTALFVRLHRALHRRAVRAGQLAVRRGLQRSASTALAPLIVAAAPRRGVADQPGPLRAPHRRARLRRRAPPSRSPSSSTRTRSSARCSTWPARLPARLHRRRGAPPAAPDRRPHPPARAPAGADGVSAVRAGGDARGAARRHP